MKRRSVMTAALAVSWPLFAVVWPRVARAEPLERGALRLEWSAPGGCPNAVEVVERIEALLGARVTDLAPEPIEARGKVRQIEPLRYGLELETRQRDQLFVRSMQAPSCAELSDAGALVLALAIDPALAERRARATEEKLPQTSALPAEPAAAQPAAPEPKVALAGTATPPEPASPRDEPPGAEAEDESTPEWSARLGLLADVGTISTGMSFGMRAGAGLGFGPFRAELGISWLPPVRTITAFEPDRGGDIDFVAGEFAGCVFPFRGHVEVQGCAGVELGRLHGAGFGTVVETEGSAPWYGFGVNGSVRLKATESLTAVAGAGFVMGLQDIEFTLENVGVVHRVSGAVARFALGIEADFP